MMILAVSDSYMSPRHFQQAFARFEAEHDVIHFQIDSSREFVPSSESERRLREYQGSPHQVVERMNGVNILAVHGAPVTDAVLDASEELRLVCCARGGPVNVDLHAITARGLPLVTTPGKNAEAVADQTVAFLVMLARRFPKAQRFLERGGEVKDNWAGRWFIGNDLRRHTLGLVGYGRIGQRVAHRSLAFGMHVLAFDPYAEVSTDNGVERISTFDELLARSDFVSLHARATDHNQNMFDATAFAKMKPGSFLVNTARETLVDEDALDAALASGRLGGAALDVMRPAEPNTRHPLLRHDNVIMTPHIGGATHETLFQGAEMVAEEIGRFVSGQDLVNVVSYAPEVG